MTSFIILGIFVVFIVIFLFFISRTNRAIDDLKNNQALNLMQQQLQSTTMQINTRLEDTTKAIKDTAVAAQQVLDIGKNISTLQDLLKPPQFRGGLGETFLEHLLNEILPSQYYKTQYVFKTGAKVDAVIHLGDKLVPVDSKFPLGAFEPMIKSTTEAERVAYRRGFMKDVKKHVNDIASKYILPDEGTYNFALMYIPAENVYYETIIKDTDTDSIFSYAIGKKVIPVSPSSFYAYLQVIIEGLRGFQIEKSVQKVIQSISRLRGDFERFKVDFDVLRTHLRNAMNKFDEAERRLVQLGDKLTATSELPDDKTKSLPIE
ncbi:MAG: DNA recombination protein RmuC [bacterium]|nr:DNA recombination protein RmuC [bacterium]